MNITNPMYFKVESCDFRSSKYKNIIFTKYCFLFAVAEVKRKTVQPVSHCSTQRPVFVMRWVKQRRLEQQHEHWLHFNFPYISLDFDFLTGSKQISSKI